MRSTISTDLFRYWQKARGRADAPLRSRIEPDKIRPLLGDIFILDADGAGAVRFRLAGTRICALFARELRGSTFDSLWPSEDMESVAAVAGDTMAHCRPALIGATGIGGAGMDGIGIGGAPRRLGVEALLLPMRSRPDRVDRILGALAPLERPRWIGADPLHVLSLDSLRYPEPDPASEMAVPAPPQPAARPRENPLSQAVRRVLHLAVLDGGRRD